MKNPTPGPIRLSCIGLLVLCPTLAKLAKAAAPERRLSVSQDGRAQFSSVQAAIDSLPWDNSSPVTIAIAPGVYRDLVRVPRGKRFVTLRGEDAARTILSFDNAATKKRPDGTLFGTAGSASTYVEADDFSARGL